jgi:hypothetical protein
MHINELTKWKKEETIKWIRSLKISEETLNILEKQELDGEILIKLFNKKEDFFNIITSEEGLKVENKYDIKVLELELCIMFNKETSGI